MIVVVVSLFVAGIGILMADFVYANTEITDGLVRNPYGKGSREEELEVSSHAGKDRKEIKIQVSEQAYTQEELKSMFQRCIVRIEKEILGENRSLDHIEKDLNLMTSLSDTPVEITWELDRYDVINIYGELQESEIAEEGALVQLRAMIRYTKDPKMQTIYECKAMVFPPTLTSEDRQIFDIQNLVKKTDEKTQTKEKLMLPGYLNGEKLSFYPKMEQRGTVLVCMSVIICILFIAMEKENQIKKNEERKEQMELDYPEIISKLTLFLGAGMTIKRAWRKTVSDYELQKTDWGIRYAYEEMKQTCIEMDSGITEAESYERFGKRCNLQQYIKLGAMLSQNLRKGAKGLSQILRMEAVQSFEERKARAKRKGEEAGTKLLAPMFLMLAVVLVIVIVPAFMSVQM